MEELDDLTKRVCDTLVRMGKDLGAVDAATLKQLAAIQKAVDEESVRIANARKAVAHGMPLSRVAELSRLARGTFYNKRLLIEYSEKAIKEAGIEEGRDEVKRLRRRLSEKEDIIAKLVERDNEIVEMRMRLRDAESEIAGLKVSLAEERRRSLELQRMLSDREKSEGGRIIPLER